MTGTLLLVVGPGRSGTSTLAGALSMLGAHVPGPHLDANKSNPKGFFESRWSVDFHNAIIARAHIGLVDARPEAGRIFQKAVTGSDREQLTAWLTEQGAGRDLMVLKDPRVVWSIPTFKSVADDLGLRLAAAVTLRHPAEVVASRLDYYRRPGAALDVPGYQTRDLAGWLNMLTICEQETRGLSRSFIGYQDLLTDWRRVLGPSLDGLGIPLSVPDPSEHHEIDDFIDPGLNRHQADWQETSVPAELQDLSQRAWDLCATLADHGGRDDAAAAGLDEVRAGYAALYNTARAVVHDEFVAASGLAREAKAKAKAKAQAKAQAKADAKADAKVRAEAEAEDTANAEVTAASSTPSEPEAGPGRRPQVAAARESRRWPRWTRTAAGKRGSTG